MTPKKPARSRGRPGRLTAEDTAKVEDRLLDSALELLNERPFSDTTMEQIARRAGASTKTLYSRFPDKAAVVQAVVNRIIERSLAAHAADVTSLDPTGIDPGVYIVSLVTKIVTGIGTEGRGLIQIALGEARRFPIIKQMYNGSLARGRGLLQHALETWAREGKLPGLTQPEMAAKLLISALTDMARIRTAMGDPMSDAEIAEFIPYTTDVLLRGWGYQGKA
jgi:AcrR family transcriptional regulator